MRTLMTIVISTMLVGCSDRPDLTKEQLDALQSLGEMRANFATSPQDAPDLGAVFDAQDQMYARIEKNWAAYKACKPGTAESREAYEKANNLPKAQGNVFSEYIRLQEIDGKKAAAEWYVAEMEKSDSQIIEKWSKPERKN